VPVTRTAWLGVAAIAITLASGCAGRSAGSPMPAKDALPTTEAPPARPRELKLDGRDPCAVVPKSDWGTFSIDVAIPEQDPNLRSPACFFNSSKGAFSIVLVVTEGVDAWAPGKRTAQPANVAPVRGFPSISLLRPTSTTQCDIAVDVAQGQYVLATVVIDLNDLSNVPERCTYAHQFAETAMNTLVAS
jgi:hypothetical protein